ncbi:MAG: hypothetical protein IPM53_03275 [Anaerolineaceae bacterium]|nr:hypothetical protein [Anaerolineaceae bacterium]
MDQWVESQLQRGGLLDELGPSRLFWSADKAILSLGGKLGWETAVPDTAKSLPEDSILATQTIEPFANAAES